MNTPSLKAGENPAADAGAAEHVKMLLGTGMAYEFQPETIATRAFLDGFALGASDLARVTAERDDWKRASEFHDQAWREESAESDALRARVAELDEKAERYRLTTLRQDATVAELTTDGNAVTLAANLAKASKRVAELEAELEKIAKADPLENGRYAAFRASAALARAESAESKSHQNPSEIRTSESAAPAEQEAPPRFHCADMSRTPIADYLSDYANAIDIGESDDAAQHAQWLRKAADAIESTPAKHPDMDWLSGLDYATQALIRAIAKAGGEYKDTTFDDEWLCVSLAPPRRGDFQLGDLRRLVRSIAAIDAARKQGGAK